MSLLCRACGVDVHQDIFTATVLTSNSWETREFEKHIEGIEVFKAWLSESRYRAMGVDWRILDTALSYPRGRVRC